MAKKTSFTRQSAERIATTVRKVEGSQSPPVRNRGGMGGDTFGRVIIGKTNGAISKGGGTTNNVSVWDGAQGSETDTGDDITAFDYFADIGSGKWVAVVETVRGFIIISAEC